MGAESGITLGVKLIITIGVCSALFLVLSVGLTMVKGQLKNIDEVNASARNSGYSMFDNKVLKGYDLVNAMKDLSSAHINNQDFLIQINTGTAHFTWTVDQSVGSVISDNPIDDSDGISEDTIPTYYVDEDWEFQCDLLKDQDHNNTVYGVVANLIVDPVQGTGP